MEKKQEKVREQHRQPDSLTIKACQNCFGPHNFVAPVINNFIHFLRIKMPEISNEEFGDSVSALLEGMNNALATKDNSSLKQCVSNTFDTVSRGEKLYPEKSKKKILAEVAN